MERKDWSSHVEWAFLMITMLGGFYLLHGSVQQQVERIDTVIHDTAARSDAIMQQATARSDRLYEMFIELVREGKCPKQEGTREEHKDVASKP